MSYLHIDELLSPIGLGSTQPCIGLANGKQVIVKFLNNQEGNKTLINELICYEIAKKLELTIPQGGLCIIDNNTKINHNVIELTEFNEDCYGIGFYSEYINNVTKVNGPAVIKLSSNYKWLLPRLILFDHLIFNKDRNPGNLLISMNKSDKSLYVIDHTHTFNLQCLWTGYSLKQKISDDDFKSLEILQYNSYLYKSFFSCCKIDLVSLKEEADFFKKRLNKSIFNDIMDMIPIEWESNKSELNDLVDYLLYRLDHLDDFCYMISSFKY
ncbi:hypothetical protein QTH51_05095 [Clostridium perfringens]|nr:hypothetical protein [Clostridium perfringens]